MQFSQIFPPSPSLTESIRLFYTSVSLLLSCTQGYIFFILIFYVCFLENMKATCIFRINFMYVKIGISIVLHELQLLEK